jgi:hypothetical protein
MKKQEEVDRMTKWFEDTPVLGRLKAQKAAEKLREIGEGEAASALEKTAASETFGKPGLWPFQDRAWQHTAHAFGYIEQEHSGIEPVPIRHAGSIPADPSSKTHASKSPLIFFAWQIILAEARTASCLISMHRTKYLGMWRMCISMLYTACARVKGQPSLAIPSSLA